MILFLKTLETQTNKRLHRYSEAKIFQRCLTTDMRPT